MNDLHDKRKHLGFGVTLTMFRLSGVRLLPNDEKRIIKMFHSQKTRKLSIEIVFKKITSLSKHEVNFIKPFQQTEIDYIYHLWLKRDED